MTRKEQLRIEARAYLEGARQHMRWARGASSPGSALNEIAWAREHLHEAAARFAEMKRIEDADERDDLPF